MSCRKSFCQFFCSMRLHPSVPVSLKLIIYIYKISPNSYSFTWRRFDDESLVCSSQCCCENTITQLKKKTQLLKKKKVSITIFIFSDDYTLCSSLLMNQGTVIKVQVNHQSLPSSSFCQLTL